MTIGKLPKDPNLIPVFKNLQAQISGVKRLTQTLQEGALSTPTTGSRAIGAPEPALPHKIAERSDLRGTSPSVKFVNINALTQTVRAIYIDRSRNQLMAGEDNPTAIARVQRESQETTYRLEVGENNQMSGTLEAEIGPIKPTGDGKPVQLQLLRITALDDVSVFAKNPSDNPFNGTVFPIPAFIVRTKYDSLDTGQMAGADIMVDADKRYFNVSPPLSTPGGPVQPIVNKVNLDTPAFDAIVTFKIPASIADPTKTFTEVGTTDIVIKLRDFAEADDATGATDEPISLGGAVGDRTKTFVLISGIFKVGRHLKFTKVVAKNGLDKIVVLASSVVDFYAGGAPPTAGIKEIQSFTLDAPVMINSGHTSLTARITQYANGQPLTSPPSPQQFATLLKLLEFTVQNPGDANPTVEKEVDLLLRGNESLFVQGNTFVVTRKVKHKANQTGITFGANIYGINHKANTPITRAATQTGNSTLTATPTATLVGTSPDDDTSEANDAFADVNISLVSGSTFSNAQVDTVIAKLRRKNGTGSDDADETKAKQIPFAIEQDEKDLTSVIKRIRDLKYAINYEIPRIIAVSQGVNVKSALLNIAFKAGLGLRDPSGIAVTGTATPNKKRDAIVTCSITQSNPPAFLKEAQILQDVGDGNGFVEVQTVNLKHKQRFQNAPGSPPVAQTFKRKVHVPPNLSGITYRIDVVAVGGLVKSSATFIQGATSGEAPDQVPSAPLPMDIIVNQADQDITNGLADLIIRCYSTTLRAAGLSFAAVNADACILKIDQMGDTGERLSFGGVVPDPTQNFVDIKCPGVVLGKVYILRKVVTKRNGIAAKSGDGNVVVVAGGPFGSIGTFGLPEISDLSLTLIPVTNNDGLIDSRHSIPRFSYTLAKSIAGTGTITATTGSQIVTGVGTSFLSQLKFHSSITVFGETRKVIAVTSNTSVMVDAPFTANGSTSVWTYAAAPVLLKRGETYLKRASDTAPGIPRSHSRLLDRQDFQGAGVHVVDLPPIQHPKKTTFTVTGRLIAVGGNFVDVVSGSMTSTNEHTMDDAGAPTLSVLPRLRWRDGHLRAYFPFNALNNGDAIGTMNNLMGHITNKVVFVFLVTGLGFVLWDPILRRTLQTPDITISLSQSQVDNKILNDSDKRQFLIDLNKEASISLPVRFPLINNPTDGRNEIDAFDDAVYNQLNAAGGVLSCRFYVFNLFGDVLTGSIAGAASNINIMPSDPNISLRFRVNEFTF